MKTIRKQATVKVMISYNYNHFETSISLENEEGISNVEINEARKDCNRLCDAAIKQYDDAKSVAARRANLKSEKSSLEREVREIKTKEESQRSVVEKAKVKALADHEWELIWDYDDDYDDR